MKIAASLLAFLICWNTSPVSGQLVYTLDDCIQIAYRMHPAMRIAVANTRSTEYSRQELEKSALPQVKAVGSAAYAPHGTQSGFDPAVTDGGQITALINASQQVYDGGARKIRNDQISVDASRLTAEQRRTARDLKYAVAAAFYDAIQAKNELELQQHRLNDLANYLDLVNRMFQGGGIKYTDVLRTKISFENAQAGIRKTQQIFFSAKISLAEAMGNPNDTSFSLRDGLAVPSSAALDSLLGQTGIDSINNIDLTIASYAIRRSMLEIDLTHTERLPSISLTGDIGYMSSFDNYRLARNERILPFGASIGISIEHPLFNWGVSDLKVQERQLDTEILKLGYEQQRLGLVSVYRRLRGDILHTAEQYEAIKGTLLIAEDHFALTKAQYAGGGISALEVLSAEQLLADLREASLQIRVDLRKLLAKLEQLSTQ